MPLPKPARVSEKVYLEAERKSEVRHEYVDGAIFAMSGTSIRHSRIALNLASALLAHLRGKPCIVVMESVQVHVARAKAYYYPDIAVSCPPDGKVTADAGHELEQPTLLVEVLSDTTEGIDRREKLHNYRRLRSLQEYVLVSQDRREVEVYRRQGDVGWLRLIYGPDEDLDLPSLGLVLPMAALYEGTDAVAVTV
jgi:Uma2 family endonuclease